jgi:hypothetical protein
MTTAVQVQYRRGTASQVAAFTGAQGEMVVDTTNNRVVVQDGSTAGGWPAAKLSEVLANTRTAVSDAAYTALASDRTIAYTAITAARIVSLPAASSFPTGTRLLVVDESGSCSASFTITLNANGTDTIDGLSTAVIGSAYGYVAIESNGSGKWTIVDQPGASAGVSSLNALTGALSIAATDGMNVSASGATVSIGAPGGFVNRFRNGTMDVWQRGASSLTATTSGSYTADGWMVVPSGASVTCSQVSNNRTGALTLYALKVLGASSVTDVIVKQRIESGVAVLLAGRTVTVQAQVYNNTGASITPKLTVKHAGSQDNWSSPATDVSAVSLQSCAASAWTQIAYSFSASSSSSNGLEVSFDFGNNFGSSSNYVYVAELDIRVTPGATAGAVNSSPPPPELRPIATELPFCLRYFQTSYVSANLGSGSVAGSLSIITASSIANNTIYTSSIQFFGKLRASPSMTIYSYNGTTGEVSGGNGTDLGTNSGSIGSVNVNQFTLVNSSGGTISPAGSYVLFYFAASSEL